MKMTKLSRIAISGFLLLLLQFIASCGSDNITAPEGSFISTNPDSMSISAGIWDTCFSDQYITITVRDVTTKPMNGVEIFIDYAWAVGHGSWNLVQFYDGATPVDAPFKVVTDKSGNYHLRADIYICSSHAGDIEIRSSSAYNVIALTVS